MTAFLYSEWHAKGIVGAKGKATNTSLIRIQNGTVFSKKKYKLTFAPKKSIMILCVLLNRVAWQQN